MSQPDFHRSWDRSLLASKRLESVSPRWLSCRHMTQQQIGMTGEGFAITGNREVCPIHKGALTQGGGSRIIYRHQSPLLMRSGNEDSEITDIKARITWCFQ